ncbi:hypothetical protein IFM89_024960 [Coptis chinensis]|uniref:RING-type domain-containing protein n=1 Tax=Coptis chinensis TaxID=261450 RepID=A0A835LVA7_9MAGN|nr:hypothetical protein IFM89_024960 [Coptis chinensis]
MYVIVPGNCSGAPVNYMGNEHISVMNCPTVANELVPVLSQPAENNMEAEDISRQRQFHISLNNSLYQDDAHCLIDNLNPNPISTGRRLSYDDEEHNSYVTEASTGMIEAFPIILPVNNNLGFEIDRQHEELDHYIRLQENHIATGLREMKQRQMASVLGIIENEVNKKLQEKEIKVEIMTLKNRELADKIQQVTMEAQSWQHRAKYNESVLNVLKSDLKQAIALSANQPKEGYGDSEVENEASSYIDHKNRPVLGGDGRPRTCRGLTCKTSKINEVSILFLPCRHLCLCEDCEGSINVCPVCQSMKAASVQVFMP